MLSALCYLRQQSTPETWALVASHLSSRACCPGSGELWLHFSSLHCLWAARGPQRGCCSAGRWGCTCSSFGKDCSWLDRPCCSRAALLMTSPCASVADAICKCLWIGTSEQLQMSMLGACATLRMHRLQPATSAAGACELG